MLVKTIFPPGCFVKSQDVDKIKRVEKGSKPDTAFQKNWWPPSLSRYGLRHLFPCTRCWLSNMESKIANLIKPSQEIFWRVMLPKILVRSRNGYQWQEVHQVLLLLPVPSITCELQDSFSWRQQLPKKPAHKNTILEDALKRKRKIVSFSRNSQ